VLICVHSGEKLSVLFVRPSVRRNGHNWFLLRRPEPRFWYGRRNVHYLQSCLSKQARIPLGNAGTSSLEVSSGSFPPLKEKGRRDSCPTTRAAQMESQCHGALSLPQQHEVSSVSWDGRFPLFRGPFRALPRRVSISGQSGAVASAATGTPSRAASTQRLSQLQSGPTPRLGSALKGPSPSQVTSADECPSTRTNAAGTAGPRADAPVYAVTGGTG